MDTTTTDHDANPKEDAMGNQAEFVIESTGGSLLMVPGIIEAVLAGDVPKWLEVSEMSFNERMAKQIYGSRASRVIFLDRDRETAEFPNMIVCNETQKTGLLRWLDRVAPNWDGWKNTRYAYSPVRLKITRVQDHMLSAGAQLVATLSEGERSADSEDVFL
jgi:hypothetical protein